MPGWPTYCHTEHRHLLSSSELAGGLGSVPVWAIWYLWWTEWHIGLPPVSIAPTPRALSSATDCIILAFDTVAE